MQRLVHGIHKAFRSNQAYAPCQKAQPARDQEEFEPASGESLLPQRWSFNGFSNIPLSQPIPGCLIADIPCGWQQSTLAAISPDKHQESHSEGYAIPRGLIPGALLGAGYAMFNTLHAYCSGRLGAKAKDRSRFCPVTQYERLERSSVIVRSLSSLLPGNSYGPSSSFNVLPKALPERRIDMSTAVQALSLEESSVEEDDDKVLAQREYKKAKDKVNYLADILRDVDKESLAADHFIAMRAWKSNDFAVAAFLWERTVEKFATPMAALRLGICYEHGHGVNQDYQRASEYYRLAISHNCSQAMYKQAMLKMNGLVEGDVDIMDLIRQSADLGYVQAQTFLGSFHFHKENKALAVKYFEKAANQNDPEACYYLGICHEIGEGVACANDKTAAECYRKAAEGGHAAAQYNIGVFHEEGYGGVEMSQETAISWYTKSSQQGNEKAKDRLRQLGRWSITPSTSLPAIGKHLPSTLSNLSVSEIIRTRSYNALSKLPRNKLPVSEDVVKVISRASSSSSVAGRPQFYVPTDDDGEEPSTFGDWSADEGLSSASSSSFRRDNHNDGFSVDFVLKNTSFNEELPPRYDHAGSGNQSWSSTSGDSLYTTDRRETKIFFA